MKRILFILVAVISFAACEDYNDQFYDKLDEAGRPLNPVELTQTLTDEDYETIADLAKAAATTDTEKDLATALKSNKYFSADATPQTYVPFLLNDLYAGYDSKSEIKITLKYFEGGLEYLEKIPNAETYTLKTEDYDSMGEGSNEPGKYNNFSSSVPPENYLPEFIATLAPNASTGDIYQITYDYYSGSVATLSDFYEFDGTTWSVWELPGSYTLATADYDSMGEGYGEPGSYNNFSSTTKPEDYLPTFMSIKFPYAKAGDEKVILYKYYSGTTKTYGAELLFDGTSWKINTGVVEKEETFRVVDYVWSWVPPIKFVVTTEDPNKDVYTLTDADYELVGNGYYKNFDVRAGKAEESEDVRLEKVSKILKTNFDIAVGDIYKVNFEVYSGQAETWSLTLKAVEDAK